MRWADVGSAREAGLAAGTMFAEAGLALPPDDPREVLLGARWVLVAHEPVRGFAAVGVLDGAAHLEELAVHPECGRRGVGSALLEAVCGLARCEGFAAVTLTTFRDVPFNAPWYRRRGFAELPSAAWGPGLREQWRREEEAGIAVAPRVAMRRGVGAGGV
ncbi:GNAT family N-acetyltransferase [Streptomonospora wellingtoniae]|uniref:GNAT family N-acetyltransferase n=1 Tax=Streptomonospora wellingtoniae TaxID=3075544 RepID=A0ABU2KS96_9ACTN|nr:GNAT family N-acetyltransferase [Streptomonospora sp. DSM 45055]MDT0302166.1 GNAT family N-acetyltransferase [Streptomonospora sp. DSM 45055]